MSYGSAFADNFAHFLDENFPDTADAMKWTGKSARQIDNYRAGICRPAPEVVAKAFIDPATTASAYRHFGGMFRATPRPSRRSTDRRAPGRRRPAPEARHVCR